MLSTLLIISVFLGVEVMSEVLVVTWHDWRERGREFATPVLSMVLQSMSWAVGWFAYVDRNVWIVLASITGSGIGCWFGIRRVKARKVTHGDSHPRQAPVPPRPEDGR